MANKEYILDFVRGLGFDPTNVKEVIIKPGVYTVTTFRLDEDGFRIVHPAEDRCLTETVEFEWWD